MTPCLSDDTVPLTFNSSDEAADSKSMGGAVDPGILTPHLVDGISERHSLSCMPWTSSAEISLLRIRFDRNRDSRLVKMAMTSGQHLPSPRLKGVGWAPFFLWY